MPLFLGMLSVMWFIAGGFMLVSGLDMMPRAFNILQQQYATGHLILAAVLLSFGGVFAALAHICERMNEHRPQPEPAGRHLPGLGLARRAD